VRTLLPVLPVRSLLAALAASLLFTGALAVAGAPPAAAEAATCAPNAPQCGDMTFHGGPIMPSITSFTIYWDPGDKFSGAYRTALNTFYQDIGFDTFFDSALQYSGNNGAIQDTALFGGTFIDTTPYPASRPGTEANPLSDDDIINAVIRGINANPSWGPPSLSRAYHSAFGTLANPVIYSALPYAGTNLNGCGTGGVSPSGNPDIDAEASIASHELMEQVTDPLLNAWYFGSLHENGDMCAFVFGKRAADGGNVTLNGHRYILQLEWSNADDSSPPDYHKACVGGWTPVRRIAGPDRIDTAVLASRDVWAPVGSVGTHALTAVLARSDDYADALAGVPLAGAEGGPLLLTQTDHLDARVSAEIRRILPSGSTIFVLGGPSALAPAVVNALQSLGYDVTRLAGGNRYSTAVAIAHDGLHDPANVLLATGIDFPDALPAGAAAAHKGAAVLLTQGTTMPSDTADYLSAHSSTRYAIGGPAAAAAPSATPIVGGDRHETSTLVASTFFGSTSEVDVATGWAFPDALGGGARAAALGIPLLLTAPSSLPSVVSSYLQNRSGAIDESVVYGGGNAVSDTVLTQIRSAIS
jgi:hypothetical protein